MEYGGSLRAGTLQVYSYLISTRTLVCIFLLALHLYIDYVWSCETWEIIYP